MSRFEKRPDRRDEPAAEEPLPEELQGEQIIDLPSREALSIVDPGVFGLGIPTPIGRTADQPPATGETPEPAPPSA